MNYVEYALNETLKALADKGHERKYLHLIQANLEAELEDLDAAVPS